jgi:hypothetical protein
MLAEISEERAASIFRAYEQKIGKWSWISGEVLLTLGEFAEPVPPLFTKKKPPWPESASELYRPSDSRLSAKLVPTFAVRGSHVISMKDRYGRILDL